MDNSKKEIISILDYVDSTHYDLAQNVLRLLLKINYQSKLLHLKLIKITVPRTMYALLFDYNKYLLETNPKLQFGDNLKVYGIEIIEAELVMDSDKTIIVEYRI